jgi:DNA-binding MarR family transcriptional regulator
MGVFGGAAASCAKTQAGKTARSRNGAFAGSENGRICFIIAAGPRFRNDDFVCMRIVEVLNYILETMRIDAFLRESPMFAVNRAARRFESLAARALAEDRLGFLEALVLAALFFEAPRQVKPSQLAETFATTRGNLSHCISSLEAKGLLLRKIDPEDARAYLLALKPQGKRCALRVIAALDRMQREFESEIGKAALAETIQSIRRLEARAVAR